MEYLPEDVKEYIVVNVSKKDRIKLREVSKFFLNMVKGKEMKVYKLERMMKILNTIESKMIEELVCEYKYKEYNIYKEASIHYYFRVMGTYDRCVGICRGERLGYVYHTPKYKNENEKNYNKRYIPYCIHCFQRWQIKRLIY